MRKKRFSIAIPCWEYNGNGGIVLDFSLDKMSKQTFSNFNIVISDHSKDDAVKKVCEKWQDKLDIKYLTNVVGRGRVSPNLNNAIRNSDGELIKLMDQDDFFYDQFALEFISDNFSAECNWMATAYAHTRDRISLFNPHYPEINSNLSRVNTIGTCSCVTVRNNDDLPLLDENLKYHHDCEWYSRLYKKYGNPEFLNIFTIINFLWNNNFTSTVTEDLINEEILYILKKEMGKI